MARKSISSIENGCFLIWKFTTYAFTFHKNIDSRANINKDAMSIKYI